MGSSQGRGVTSDELPPGGQGGDGAVRRLRRGVRTERASARGRSDAADSAGGGTAQRRIGLDHALASRRVYTDGAEVIFNYADRSDDDALLTVVRAGQQHFAEVIKEYLRPITYGEDGWAERIHLPAYSSAAVVVDPDQAFGQPFVVRGGARVEDLVDRFQAGDTSKDIADDFRVSASEAEDVIRVALRVALRRAP